MQYDKDPEIAAIQQAIEILNAANLRRKQTRNAASYLFMRLANEFPWADLPYPRFESWRADAAAEREMTRRRSTRLQPCDTCSAMTRRPYRRCWRCRRQDERGIATIRRAVSAGNIDGLAPDAKQRLENLGRLIEHKGPTN